MSDVPLVRVTDLHVWFRGEHGTVRAVNGVSLDIHEGETLALVGESGCGKSTLARALMGLAPIHAGRVEYRGEEVPKLGTARRQALCREMQMVFQDPAASLNPRMTLASAIAEPLTLHRVVSGMGAGKESARALDDRVCDLLEQVGFDPALRSRYPHELSGGQRQRVCIARALAVNPRFIVCDEAVSALDVSIQAQILNLLQSLQQKTGLTYLFITHDLGVVRHLADRVAVMYLGEVVESRRSDALFASPAHPYTQLLLSAVPTIAGSATLRAVPGELPSPLSPPSGCDFHPRCSHVMDRCNTEKPRLHVLGDRAPELGASRCHLHEARTRATPTDASDLPPLREMP